jgi:hypothetical protein
MLYDRSHGQTTQVYGENATPFEYGRPRRLVVQEDLNTIVGMGGKGRDLVRFELEWHQNPVETLDKLRKRDMLPTYAKNPRLARTIDDIADTVLASSRMTRLHTPGSQQLRMRYARVGPKLGSGTFGSVYAAVDVDSGKLMAVKILSPGPGITARQREVWIANVPKTLKREVELLATINHVSEMMLNPSQQTVDMS